MRLTQGLCRAVAVKPDGVATIDGDRVRTWRQVGDRVARFAAALTALGVAPGDRVAVLSQNCDRFLEVYFAVFWAGAVIVPLNTRLTPAEILFQIDDAGAGLVLFSEEFAGVVEALRLNGERRRLFIGLDGGAAPADRDYEALIAGHAPAAETLRASEDLAGIFYTGGTTGLPKGVMLRHASLAAMAVNLIMHLQVDGGCVNLHSAPMFHLADIGIFMTTMVAGTHVFVRRLDEAVMLELIERHRVTHLFTVPAMIDRLARHPDVAAADLSSLKVMGYGGAPMPTGVYDLARGRFPHVDFVQGFGMTEMGAHTFLGAEHHRPGADPEKRLSAGQPCYGYELKIIGEDGAERPRRQIGEIVGRGDNVIAGYWNRPEETAERLKDGWMHSQDVGFMDEEGFLYITDRMKDMIITGGENVYSIEVENAISKHPAVAECAVIGVPDERWGERVHAVVVVGEGDGLTLEALEAFCRERLAGYKRPRSLEVRQAPLPRSAAGKVLKTELRAPHWSDRPRGV